MNYLIFYFFVRFNFLSFKKFNLVIYLIFTLYFIPLYFHLFNSLTIVWLDLLLVVLDLYLS